MITRLPEEEVVRHGARLVGDRLVAQAGFTLALAGEHGAAFAAELGPSFLQEVGETADAVRAGYSDRELAEEERRLATVRQNEQVRAAKLWRRRVAAFGQVLALAGHEVSREVREVGPSTHSVPTLHGDLLTKLGHLQGMSLSGADEHRRNVLLRSGEAILGALGTADAAQELKVESLPVKTRQYWHKKGLLYLGLKQINVIARSIFADDTAKAAQFSFHILYRKAGKRGESPESGPTG